MATGDLSGPAPKGAGTPLEAPVSIPSAEWRAAAGLLEIITRDERDLFGQVRLCSDGRQRTWLISDRYRLVLVVGGIDAGVYDVGLSPALVEFAALVAADDVELELSRVVVDGTARLRVSGPTGHMTHDDRDRTTPPIAHLLDPGVATAGECQVEAKRLHTMVKIADRDREFPPEPSDEPNKVPPFVFAIGAGEIVVRRQWPVCGPTEFALHEPTAHGAAQVTINPDYLLSIIETFQPDETITVVLPDSPTAPLQLHGPGAKALLMPIAEPPMTARPEIERMLQFIFGPAAVFGRTAEGHYPIGVGDDPAFAELIEGPRERLRVFAVVAEGVTAGHELLTELNDLNRHLPLVRLSHAGEQVLAEVELLADGLQRGAIREAYTCVRDVVDKVAPTLTAVFGGVLPPAPSDARLAADRQRIVDAEVSPGSLSTLNGPDAVVVWPFPGPVHVLTAADPYGQTMDDGFHQECAEHLVRMVHRGGHHFVQGRTRVPGRDADEASLIVWGMTRARALEIAVECMQDAVFELDAEHMHLVPVSNAPVESWPRVAR